MYAPDRTALFCKGGAQVVNKLLQDDLIEGFIVQI